MSTAQGVIGGGKGLNIRDLRLVERAAREGWTIGEALRDDVIGRLATIIRNPASSDRAVTSAARALLGFSRTNLASIAQMLQVDRHVYGMHSPALSFEVIPPVSERHEDPPDDDIDTDPEPADVGDPSSFDPFLSSFSDSGPLTSPPPAVIPPDSCSFYVIPSSFFDDDSVTGPEPSAASPDSSSVFRVPSSVPDSGPGPTPRPSAASPDSSSVCPFPSSFSDSVSAPGPQPSISSPNSSSVFRVPSSVPDSGPAPTPTPAAAHAKPPASSISKKSRAAGGPSPSIGHRPSAIGHPPSATDHPLSAPIGHRPSAIGRPPSDIDPLPLEYVTHLELFAEDPTPTAPAIERVSKARVRFRVGKGVDVWVPPPTLIPRLPPCPERDLLLNHRLQIGRVDDPSRYEPD